MDPDAITADVVHDALHSIRHAQRLDRSPLLGLGVPRARLRAEGRADSPEGRSAQLARYLDEVVAERLAALRGTREPAVRGAPTPEVELAQLGADFAAGSAELEAWSTLQVHFLAATQLPVREVAAAVGISQRTLSRRARRGCALLAQELRRREVVSPVAAKHNIPHPLTRFIGREGQMDELRALLARHRLVTLTGVGGIGKSRLATEIGRALAGEYEYDDGAWLVELGAVEEGDHVVAAVAAVLGVRERSRRAPVETLCGFLAGKRLLLLLDNCEHLAAACAALVETLMAKCPVLTVLATSRAPLHVAGEYAMPVPPLPVPDLAPDARPSPGELAGYDGVRLFTDRASTAMPGFEMTPDNAPHLAAVCRALDGIPLAMELAASRVRVLSPRELALRMATPFELLRDGRRPDLPHHATLRATMDWSFALLGETDQVLFRRLSVFRGGWTPDAAAAVCADSELPADDVLARLPALVDKSLVDVRRDGGAPRFRMLRTVRQYAAEQLAACGEIEAVPARHLYHYLELAETAEPELVGPRQIEWLDRLETEHANLRAALRWSCDHADAERGLRLGGAVGRYWRIRGHWNEGLRHVTDLLELPGAEGRAAPRAGALNTVGVLSAALGRYDAARAAYDESLAIRRRLGDDERIAQTLNNLSVTTQAQGDFYAARAFVEEGLAIYRRLGNRIGEARSLGNRALIEYAGGALAEARALYNESLAVSRELDDPFLLAQALQNLASVAVAQGDFAAVRSLAEECLAIRRQLGDQVGIADALNTLGTVACDREDDPEVAGPLFEEGLAIYRRLGDQRGIAIALYNLGCVAERRDEPASAHALYTESLSVSRALDEPAFMVANLAALAEVAGATEQHREAAVLLATAEAQSAEVGGAWPPADRPEIAETAAACRTALGDSDCDAAHAEGRALTLEAAVARALGEPGRPVAIEL